MKKQLPGFLAGIIVTVVAFTSIPALAAQLQTIKATLNSVNIEVNGQKVASTGEGYVLENGQETAGSIVYNDTTYVPIRRFGEIMGADIGWNQATGSVTVTGESAPTTTPAPDNTALPADYSDWSAEEEAAYQEFKGMWEMTPGRGIPDNRTDVVTTGFCTYSYNGKLTELELFEYLELTSQDKVKAYSNRMVEEELYSIADRGQIIAGYGLDEDTPLWSVRFSTFSQPQIQNSYNEEEIKNIFYAKVA